MEIVSFIHVSDCLIDLQSSGHDLRRNFFFFFFFAFFLSNRYLSGYFETSNRDLMIYFVSFIMV